MKQIILPLLLTLAVGLLGSYHATWQNGRVDQRQVQQVQNDIVELDRQVLRLLEDVRTNGTELQSLRHLWEERGIGMVVYNGSGVTEWTTSAIPFTIGADERHRPKQGIVRLKNAWYLCRTMEEQGDLLAAFALLRTDHGFENRYISNSWGPAIRAGQHLTLSLSDHNGGIVSLSDGTTPFGLRLSPVGDDLLPSWNTLIWVVFILLLLITFWRTSDRIGELTNGTLGHVAFLLMTLGMRTLMLWWQLPTGIYRLELFGPGPHATSALIPSLGDLILHAAFLLPIIVRFSKERYRVGNRWMQTLIGMVLPVLLLWPVHELFEVLVFNSSFSLNLNSPFSLSAYSLVGLVVSFLVLLNFFLALRLFFHLVEPDNRRPLRVWLPLTLGSLILGLLLGADLHAWTVAMSGGLVCGFLMMGQDWMRVRTGIYRHIPNVLAISLLACLMLGGISQMNEQEARKAIARKIDQQQDPVAEFLFSELADDLLSDRKLRLALTSTPPRPTEALGLIHGKLAYDHWHRYRPVVDVFDEAGALIVSDRDHTGPNYFELQSQYEQARPTVSGQLGYVGHLSTGGGYLARLVLDGNRSQNNLVMFIALVPEKTDDILGFTDLFVAEEISTAKEREGYSYALYAKGELKERHGSFAYSLTDRTNGRFPNEHTFVVKDGFSHLVYRPVDDRTVVVTREADGFMSYLTMFSYLFLFYLGCSAITSLVSGRLMLGLSERRSFRNRINMAMGSVLLVSMLLIGLLTVFYVVREYHDRNEEMISEKSRSVLIELEHKLRDRQSLDEADRPMLNALLVKFSKVFFTDINLYQLDGRLLATSRPRLFDEGMMAEVIDPQAYTQMRFVQRSSFIQEETIGNLQYLTAYVPFRNEKQEVVAFMSLPYFARQYGLQQEVFSLLAALTNIYVFLILFSVVLALIISDRITEPLYFIRESLKNLKLDQANRAIEWKSNDEIGELVEEYNRTLNELVQSAELLARSERESAWREMAKQVAHEIKNPLTPMKLSIQMLQRSRNDGAQDLPERIDRMTATLIEQIDTLSNIATEFSTFAQMPKTNIESINLGMLMENVAELHRHADAEIVLNLQADVPSIIQADREQVLRALNNLIKNGIQAVPDERKPVITLGLIRDGNRWVASIKDNGSGIVEDLKERIFVPNFTTKSSGMGLGLAMVKNTIETVNGKIWFHTEMGVGTTFYISFPAT